MAFFTFSSCTASITGTLFNDLYVLRVHFSVGTDLKRGGGEDGDPSRGGVRIKDAKERKSDERREIKKELTVEG